MVRNGYDDEASRIICAGERRFDFANVFCNPDPDIAAAPGRLARQVKLVAQAAGLERVRLLKWILAYAGLSAAWILEDRGKPKLELAVAELAASELANFRFKGSGLDPQLMVVLPTP